MPHAGRPGESCPLLPGRVCTALVTYTDRMVEDWPGRSPHVLRWRAPVRRWLTTGVAIAGLLTVAIGVEAALGQPGPNTPSPFSSLAAEAEAAREGGDLEKAVPSYRKALTIRPDWREGWWALGTILYDQDAHADAARAFRRLLDSGFEQRHGTPDAGALRVSARSRCERDEAHPGRQNAGGSEGWRADAGARLPRGHAAVAGRPLRAGARDPAPPCRRGH